jgi:hypothetical protein
MTTNDGNGASVFAQYIDGPKERSVEPEKILRGPLLKPIAPSTDRRSPPVERLLDFCINHWREPIISARAIVKFGPNPIRNRKSAIKAAEALVEHGWLERIASRRRDMREYRIARGAGG